MKRQIPPNFDYKTELIDSNEKFVRDNLNVNVSGWAKFRNRINVGNNANVLISPAPIDAKIKEAYIELAKSHYEVVKSLGFVKLSLDQTVNAGDSFFFEKTLKEFYLHCGSVLDNLSRLIYIINDPNSPFEVLRKNYLLRHWIDWPLLVRENRYPNYSVFTENNFIKEILNIRNNFTHNWACIVFINRDTGKRMWPIEIRNDRNYLWHYEELEEFKMRYKNLKNIDDFLNEDWNTIEEFQNKVFEQLVIDVELFENHFNLEII